MKAAIVIAMTAMISEVYIRDFLFANIILPHILFKNKEE
ncbi:hypothetical protein SRABI96_03904 [Peribacillus sp. Bi96]|nr:hypothetical protein SRABI96_03904 [Peribacillus sp. Bi96]